MRAGRFCPIMGWDNLEKYWIHIIGSPPHHGMKSMYLLMRIVCIFALLSLVATAIATTNSVQVFVYPGLGQVCIDNRECESSTGAASNSWNVDFDDVTAGSAHTITVTADGYQTATTQITVLPDRVNEATVTLQPISSAADTSVPKTQAGSGRLIMLVAAGICGIVFVWKCRD